MASTQEKLSPQGRIWSRNFTCAMLANFFLSVSHFSVNTLVATYTKHLGADPVLMGFLTGMFFGVALAIRPISGPLMTKVDKRKLMIFISVLGAVVNIGYAMFRNIPAFVFFRFLHGVQYSFVGALIMTVASDALPPDRMATGIGIFGIGSAIGQAVGPTIGDSLERLGTSLFLKNTAEQVLDRWGWSSHLDVQATDTISAKGRAKDSDAILTSGAIADTLGEVGVRVEVIENFTSQAEIDAALRRIYAV